MTLTQSKNYDTILYHVRSGDNLSKIITRYHGPVNAAQRDAIISQIKIDNPQVKNPNRIYPDQLLHLGIPPQYCSATTHSGQTPIVKMDKHLLKPLQQQWNTANKKEKKLLSELTPLMFGTGSAGMTMLKQSFAANTPLLTEMAKNYEEYKAGTLTKGQYDYRRKKLLASIKSRLGPLKRLMNGSRSSSEMLRISKTKGRAPTQNITRQIGRMGRIAKNASRGSVILTAVSLGVACNDIANTDDTYEKNKILVESVGGVLGGIVAGVAVMLMFTPVGWVAALAVGVAGAVGGYASGKAVSHLYDKYGNKINVASATGIAQLCR